MPFILPRRLAGRIFVAKVGERSQRLSSVESFDRLSGMEEGSHSPKRILFVETVRFLALLIVIMQHVPCGAFPPNRALIGAALASFFMLAGFFSALRIQGKNAFRWTGWRFVRLFVPYVFWSFLYWFVIGAPMDDFWLCRVLGIGACPLLTPMWFIRDLLLFTLVAFLLKKYRFVLYAAGIFCFFLCRSDHSMSFPSPYMFGNFVLGIVLAHVAPKCLSWWNRLPASFHGAVVVSTIVLMWVSCGGAVLRISSFSAVCVAVLFSAGVLLERLNHSFSERVAKWAEGGFFVYCFHVFVLMALMGAEDLTDCMWRAEVWWCLVPVIYAVSLGIYRLFCRYCPIILFVMTGRQ